MADWKEYFQSIFFALLFSFLLAKLFSIIFTFRHQNLRISRSETSSNQLYDVIDDVDTNQPLISNYDNSQTTANKISDVINDDNQLLISKDEKSETTPNQIAEVIDDDDVNRPLISIADKSEKTLKQIDDGIDDDEDDSDWEGVESTELDEAFSAATAFVAATAADRRREKVSSDVQLMLYGLYKIATEGPCTAPPPSVLKMTARAKWQAWQKLGPMPPEEAMGKYLDIVTGLLPSWLSGSETKSKGEENKGSMNSKGPMGPVFSTFSLEEESGTQLEMDAIHAFAREGDEENLLKCIASGVSVNVKDSEGRTPLHWAVDRGHQNVVELLISKNSDLNIKDDEGQTPLHYAAVCERASIAEFLVQQNADLHIRDNDGNSPGDLCEQSWPWMQNRE